MQLAVQLDLDPTTSSAIDRISAELEHHDGLETVRQIGDVPHLSLAIYDDFPPAELAAKVAGFAATLTPVPLRLANIGIFTGIRSVLFLGLVVTEPLLALHRECHRILSPFRSRCSEHFRPGAWIPHVTLAMNVTPDTVPACVGAVAANWTPADATLDAVRLIRFRPVETLYLQPLAPKM